MGSDSVLSSLGNPRDCDPERYVTRIRGRNVKLLNDLRAVLAQNLGIIEAGLENIVSGNGSGSNISAHIVTTGSDGREEKKGDQTSPIEAIVLLDRVPTNNVEDIEAIRKRCMENLLATMFFPSVEVKILDRDDVAAYQDGANKPLWPSRIIDAVSLSVVNVSLLTDSKIKLHGEILSDVGKGKIVKRVRDRFSEYRVVCQRGGLKSFHGKDTRHFDVEKGEMYFDSQYGVKVWSVKYGPLRAVQMFLVDRLIRFMRANPTDPTLLLNVPANTEDKIRAMVAMGALALSESAVNDLIRIYKYFLWCFYISEHDFTSQGSTVAAIPDPQTFRKNLEDLVKLLKI